MRDTQKSKVYSSEHRLEVILDRAARDENPLVQVGGISLTLPPEAKFASIASIQTYVDRVLAIPAIAELNDRGPIRVRSTRKGARKAHHQGNEIAVPDERLGWAMREIVVLHEVAHHLAWDHHGPQFAESFLTLLDVVMGPEIALALRVIFDDHGVKTAPLKVSA
jgi:putative metallohydrolase (TIGR04338 family)